MGADGALAISPDPTGLLHRPSGDVLLQSLAEQIGSTSIGVVLTGMGDDGTRGLLAIRDAGGTTLAQDAASCAVFGMPRAARDLRRHEHAARARAPRRRSPLRGPEAAR
jgi:two-component system chemotaxis response regulator CheB